MPTSAVGAVKYLNANIFRLVDLPKDEGPSPPIFEPKSHGGSIYADHLPVYAPRNIVSEL